MQRAVHWKPWQELQQPGRDLLERLWQAIHGVPDAYHAKIESERQRWRIFWWLLTCNVENYLALLGPEMQHRQVLHPIGAALQSPAIDSQMHEPLSSGVTAGR